MLDMAPFTSFRVTIHPVLRFLPIMHPSRDHHLPPDPDAYRHAPHPRGRIIVIAPTRAACETIELALGLHLETLLEREHGEEIRDARGFGQGLRHRRGHRHRQDARHPADRRGDSRRAAPRRRGEPRAGGHARDARLERGHRHHRHRAAVVPGRPHHRARHADRRRDPPDLRRAGAVPRAGQAGGLPLHLALRDRRPDVLRALPRQRGGARDLRLRSQAQGARSRSCRQKPVEFLDERFVRHIIKERRGVAVFLPTRAEVEQPAAQVLGEQWPSV